MKKHAIFIDIDGTLASFENFPHPSGVPAENIRAIERVRRLGHYVFLNTGRAYSWIPAEALEVPVDGIISGMGTQVLINGSSIYENTIDHGVLQSVLKELLAPDKLIMVAGTKHLFLSDPRSLLSAYFDYIKLDSPDIMMNYPDETMQKFEIFSSDMSMDKFSASISEDQLNMLEKHFRILRHKAYMECCPKSASKSFAMKLISEKLDIPLENCIAMGDSVNDLDMLDTAGISVAMGNAGDKVKKSADMITASCVECGVAHALDKLIPN